MHAFCWASGLIGFAPALPKGALPIATGPAQPLRDYIEARARHGYRTRKLRGRAVKIPGSDTLLVPGVPEAPDEFAGVEAVQRFCDWLRKGAPDGISVR